MRYSRLEVLNAVRELSRFMTSATEMHYNVMHRVMRYCANTPKKGLMLAPTAKWDGNKDFEFTVMGISDSNYATRPDTRKSVSGYSVFLNDAPVTMKSGMQKTIALSVAEAELFAATQCAQDMLYVMHILNGIGLKVREPLFLKMDNKGAIDLINNYSVGGRTKHVDMCQYFLRELRKKKVIKVIWLAFEKHTKTFVLKKVCE